ncbi:BTB/POZ domain-containing protein 3-like [Gigantopelta aegis]|uniref:BTB/POZ domain-containing protein 3-like n=1 Tax=Gigantopelta aegis TaxID=1735272 RepID=UPI001B88AA9D|nr:BTB/POZ domain-containing protein 3-like [Gigantopelta aegis]
MATKESKSEVQSGYVDNWQKGKSVIESLGYSLEEKILCDVTFIVGENRKRIQAHRLILSLRSCVFMAMLTGPLAEQDDIEIPDIDSEVFDQFLRFLYTDVLSIEGRNVIGLLYASKKYDIIDMENKCLTYIESSLSSHDVCFVMEHAHLYNVQGLYNDRDLMKKALAYISENAKAVLKSDSFCDLCHDCFMKVIEADQLNASEESVFEASIAWSEAECRRQGREVTPENRRSVLGESMHLVRYSKINPNYFVQKVSLSSLLTEAEENKILRCFINRSQDVSPFKSNDRLGTHKTKVAINRFDNISYVKQTCYIVKDIHAFNSLYSLKQRRPCTFYEGITFCLNASAELQGFQFYGYLESSDPSSVTYSVTASVCDASTDGVIPGSEIKNEISSSNVVYDVDFPSPIQLTRDRKYNLSVTITMPQQFTGCEVVNCVQGADGKSVVSHGSFTCSFYDHKKCKHLKTSNRTSVLTGQIPGLKFLL